MASASDGDVLTGAAVRGGALERARRHSALVRKLRLGLPILAVALIAGAGLSYMGLSASYGPVSIERISMENGALKIEQPRLSGVTEDDRAYEVSAQSARQDAAKPNMVALDGVVAEIEEAGGGKTRLTAAHGAFNTNKEWLDLNSDIQVRWPAGHTMRLSQVRIHMKTGTIVSRAPVAIDMLNGDLQAQKMHVDTDGKVVTFSGGVTLEFRPKGAAQ